MSLYLGPLIEAAAWEASIASGETNLRVLFLPLKIHLLVFPYIHLLVLKVEGANVIG